MFILSSLLVFGFLFSLTGNGSSSGPGCLVGAYYYPWYGPGAHPISDSARMQLRPAQQPLLGNYSSRDQNVIREHVKQSMRGNIAFWTCSWWGPGSYEDVTIKNYLRKGLGADGPKYAILYETAGRLGSSAKPNYDRFLSDVDYLARTFFADENYLRIKGRPALFIYLTRDYFRGKGDETLARLREAHPDLYLVGDDVFGPGYKAEWAARWDAVTAYDVYGQCLGRHGSTDKALATLCDYAIFARMLKEAALPYLDPRAERMLMVTSFNEWHEDTQSPRGAGANRPTCRH